MSSLSKKGSKQPTFLASIDIIQRDPSIDDNEYLVSVLFIGSPLCNACRSLRGLLLRKCFSSKYTLIRLSWIQLNRVRGQGVGTVCGDRVRGQGVGTAFPSPRLVCGAYFSVNVLALNTLIRLSWIQLNRVRGQGVGTVCGDRMRGQGVGTAFPSPRPRSGSLELRL